MKILIIQAALLPFFKSHLSAQTPLFKLLSPWGTNIRFSNDINESENLKVLAYEYFYNCGGEAVGDINNDGFHQYSKQTTKRFL